MRALGTSAADSMLFDDSLYTLKGYVRNGAGLTTEFVRTFSTNWLSLAAPVNHC